MIDKIAIVTGGASGIGLETALGIARTGAHVVIVGRDEDKARSAVRWIENQTRAGAASFLIADLSTRAGIHTLASSYRKVHERLDILVNNAGAMFETRELTADGFERHWGLNHLAYVQLTVELLSMLKSSIPARIVNVASSLHAGGAINFADLQQATRFDMRKAYSQSKLANVMFTYALARRLAGTGVTVNCLHPGVVRTGLTDGMKSMKRLLVPLIKPFMLTPAQGAVTSIFAATSPDVERISGRYFVKSRPAQSSKPSYDEAAQERLWKISLEQCQLNDPTIN